MAATAEIERLACHQLTLPCCFCFPPLLQACVDGALAAADTAAGRGRSQRFVLPFCPRINCNTANVVLGSHVHPHSDGGCRPHWIGVNTKQQCFTTTYEASAQQAGSAGARKPKKQQHSEQQRETQAPGAVAGAATAAAAAAVVRPRLLPPPPAAARAERALLAPPASIDALLWQPPQQQGRKQQRWAGTSQQSAAAAAATEAMAGGTGDAYYTGIHAYIPGRKRKKPRRGRDAEAF